jgi:hypothetical protein
VSPLLISNNDIVTVTFTSSSPSSSDWIGAYSPPDVNILESTPVLYGCCTGSCSGSPTNNYLTDNTASLNFNMTNLRAGIKFYYFTGGTDTPTMVASSNQIVNFENINQPLKNRVVATGNPNVYNLLWSSANATTPYMVWGTSSGHYQYNSSGTMSWINITSMCAAPANSTGFFDLGTINTASIVGIEDYNLYNTDIFYRFGDRELNLTSQEFKFHVPPKAGTQPPTRPTTVALFADLGVGVTDSSIGTEVWYEACAPAINTTMSVSALVEQGEIDAIIHTGDISYADGYLATWDFFLNMISPMSSGALYFTTVGNHETDSYNSKDSYFENNASGGECTVCTFNLLPMPAPAGLHHPWYSYEIGLIHFTMMSTESNFTIGSPQWNFLKNDLASVNRTKTPWLIFTGHRGMYVDSDLTGYQNSDVEVMELLQANIEPLLYEYQVNLAFSGHFHNLQRQSAIYQNKTVVASKVVYNSEGEKIHYYENPNATVWMIIGSAGNGPNYSSQNYSWSEFYWNNVYGYAVISAINATTLSWKLYESSKSQVIDNVVITQDFAPWPPVTPTTNDSSDSTSEDLGLILGLTFGLLFGFIFIGLGVFCYMSPKARTWIQSSKRPMSEQSIDL